MTNYDNNERYEKIDEETYRDTETDELVFVLSDEQQTKLSQLIREHREKSIDQND
jgi:hypothetical protein